MPGKMVAFRKDMSTVWCALSAFSAYFCMYAFRKPFSAGTYQGLEWYGYDYKAILVLSQLIGYTLSKFIGIKIISEFGSKSKLKFILIFILFAWTSLLGFAVSPSVWGMLWLFANGLPLGMIWGLIFAILEGRRLTEVLAAVLSASFIVSSGIVKAVGLYLLELGMSERWMPFFTGLLFFPSLIFSLTMLGKIPSPTERDIAERSQRVPMSRADRWKYFARYGPGLTSLLFLHLLLTGYRDFRDQFAIEILNTLNIAEPANLWLPELFVGFGVLAILGLFSFIKSHGRALFYVQIVMLLGVALTAFITILFLNPNLFGRVPPVYWFTLTGLGLYAAYVPFHSILFERFVAKYKIHGNSGFLIYLADSTGYLGTLIVLLVKIFYSDKLSAFNFFINFTYLFMLVCPFCLFYSIYYFSLKNKFLHKNANP